MHKEIKEINIKQGYETISGRKYRRQRPIESP
jgi:hypothetical protein